MTDPIDPTTAPPPTPRGRLRRAAAWPFVLVASILVLLDDAFRVWVKPAVAGLARLAPIKALEGWIAGLPPYGIVALFVVPLLVIEPMKIAALYFIGTGHWISGILVFVVAKIVGVGIAERLFAIGREKLLSIGWFRWLFERAMRIKDRVHAWLASKPIWQQATIWIERTKAALVRAKASLAAWWTGSGPTRSQAAPRLAGGFDPPPATIAAPDRAAQPIDRHGLVP